MNKIEMKRIINEEFGFATNKIILLESGESCGKVDYIMFEVCGIIYQTNYNWIEETYKLKIWHNKNKIEIY